MSMINKEMYEDTHLFSMKWEVQELEQIILDKKNKLADEELNWCYEQLMETIEKNQDTKEIKSLLSTFARSIQQIEREI